MNKRSVSQRLHEGYRSLDGQDQCDGIHIAKLLQNLNKEDLSSAVTQGKRMLCEELGIAYSLLLEQELDCRIAQNNDRRNGSYERRLLSSIGDIVVSIPRGRCTSVADVLCKYQRRLNEFDAIVISSVSFGHSMRHTAKLMAQLCENSGISRSTVSSIMKTLDSRAQSWRSRPLTKPYAYLWLDAKVVMIAGAMKRPSFVVAAMGATADGEQEILGFAVCSSESEAQWSAFFAGVLSTVVLIRQSSPLLSVTVQKVARRRSLPSLGWSLSRAVVCISVAMPSIMSIGITAHRLPKVSGAYSRNRQGPRHSGGSGNCATPGGNRNPSHFPIWPEPLIGPWCGMKPLLRVPFIGVFALPTPSNGFFENGERLCKRRQCAFADKGSVMRIYYAIAAEYCANNPLMAPVKAQRREMNRNLDGEDRETQHSTKRRIHHVA